MRAHGERLSQRPERGGIGRLVDLLEHRLDRLASPAPRSASPPGLERLSQRQERTRIGRLAELLEHHLDRLARLRLAQLRRQGREPGQAGARWDWSSWPSCLSTASTAWRACASLSFGAKAAGAAPFLRAYKNAGSA